MTAETKLSASADGASDPDLSRGRVCKKLYVLHAMAQLVEGGLAATEQDAPGLGKADTVRISLQQPHAENMLQLTDRPRDDRMRDGELARSLRHAPALRHDKENMQIAQLQPASDSIFPAHGSPLSKIANQVQDNRAFQLMIKRAYIQCRILWAPMTIAFRRESLADPLVGRLFAGRLYVAASLGSIVVLVPYPRGWEDSSGQNKVRCNKVHHGRAIRERQKNTSWRKL